MGPLFRIVLLAALALCTLGSRCAPEPAPRIVGYFASWSIYDRDYQLTDVPVQSLTHLNYAFASMSAEGTCVPGDPWADLERPISSGTPNQQISGNFAQLRNLKQQHPHLRTLISVGGWTGSARFSDVAATAQSRRLFASSCVAFLLNSGFDGIDIDWEFPVSGGLPGNVVRPGDRENFTLLLVELRSQLDAAGAETGQQLLLTIAAPAAPQLYANLELGALASHIDWINLMTYDFRGGWSAQTGFHAPLFDDPGSGDGNMGLSAHDAVEGYLRAGVPRRKIVMGVPFYGRGWQGVPATHAGLHQPHSGVPAGTWEPGLFDFWDLASNFLPQMRRSWHDIAQVPWLYDEATGLMISYEDAESLAAKARYVHQSRLAGVMAWELSGDDASGTLVNALRAELYPKDHPSPRFPLDGLPSSIRNAPNLQPRRGA